ncbi:hypothetical protein chiPu_0010623 [Chiloscyllium punctatum]|uniref:Uncharacterized protein n=1 Tax=Chiloscyllium punctatum TaxID=137246 RepID=A0A401SP61_CHIPU|nr:hypothetical protein [Chiloscyllium punctatum]
MHGVARLHRAPINRPFYSYGKNWLLFASESRHQESSAHPPDERRAGRRRVVRLHRSRSLPLWRVFGVPRFQNKKRCVRWSWGFLFCSWGWRFSVANTVARAPQARSVTAKTVGLASQNRTGIPGLALHTRLALRYRSHCCIMCEENAFKLDEGIDG